MAGQGRQPGTVQAWLGHESIATNQYLHHLGTAADVAGLDRLNTTGVAAVASAADLLIQ